MKYAAINIGPIIGTLSMARKPRELKRASGMFSYLMGCIIDEIAKQGIEIISPAVITEESDKTKGLYPDRVFVKGKDIDNNLLKSITDSALETFKDKTGIGKKYVNVSYVVLDESSSNTMIKDLNQLLDCTELCGRTIDGRIYNKVLQYIQEEKEKIPMLAEIATKELEFKDERKYKECLAELNENANDDGADFYADIKRGFSSDFYSYHKYICVVQADGDNMGKIVSAVGADNVVKVSEALLKYGKEVWNKVKDYGGLPIYAGGDDLLFLAPVRGKDSKSIFGLIDDIDLLYKKEVDDAIGSFRPNGLNTTLSYGLSISYYKYPLYEAFGEALSLLFGKAKQQKQKNALAWTLRKHSGSGFKGVVVKDKEDESIYGLLNEISNIEVEEKQVSAIAHKLRVNEDLLGILLNLTASRAERIAQFYKKTMEESEQDKYKQLTRELLCKMFDEANSNVENSEEKEVGSILENMYSMLRTIKFIKGEGDSDE